MQLAIVKDQADMQVIKKIKDGVPGTSKESAKFKNARSISDDQ